jgi:hypothetical protein
MSKIEWRVDAGTHIVLHSAPFSRHKVELNGQVVEGEWRSKRFDFALTDGRPASITLKAETMSRQNELLIDGKFFPDTSCVPKDLRCPACKAEIQLLDEFCTKCGHALGTPSRFMPMHSVQGATTAIKILAALYLIFGVGMYFFMRGDVETVLTNLAPFADHEVLQPINNVVYTAGELRQRVIWEHRGTLIVNLILAGLMLVLAWWSRRKPLAAILIAAAIFAAMQVLNAMIDPKTLMQGLIIKVIIIVVLARGIKGALDMRTANG